MTFVVVPWTNGDEVEESKLDDMVANDVHVRYEANFKTLMTGAAIELYWWQSSDFEIDDQDFGTSPSWNGSQYTELNIDISLVPNGLHTLSLFDCKIRFMKTPDLQRISYWYNVETINEFESDEYEVATNVTVIGHRETQSWT